MKAGKFIVRSTYCIFAIAQKTHVAIVAENINVNVIMPPQLSVILAADISALVDCQWQSRSVVYWLSSVRWPHCLHPRKSLSELLCEIIPTPFSEFAAWQLTPEIYWIPSDHICTSHDPSRRLQFQSTSGFAFLLFHVDLVASATSKHSPPSCGQGLSAFVWCLFVTSQELDAAAQTTCLLVIALPPHLIKSLAVHLCLGNLCSKNVAKSELGRYWDMFLSKS